MLYLNLPAFRRGEIVNAQDAEHAGVVAQAVYPGSEILSSTPDSTARKRYEELY
jgi:hypothetical protein